MSSGEDMVKTEVEVRMKSRTVGGQSRNGRQGALVAAGLCPQHSRNAAFGGQSFGEVSRHRLDLSSNPLYHHHIHHAYPMYHRPRKDIATKSPEPTSTSRTKPPASPEFPFSIDLDGDILLLPPASRIACSDQIQVFKWASYCNRPF
jgi:hypothetical protein